MLEMTVDTSVLVAVITNAEEKEAMIHATREASLVAPRSVHWEVGNAFSAMMRRKRIDLDSAIRALEIYRSIPVRWIEVDLEASLAIAKRHGLYAYDAYLIECARSRKADLLTLDRSLAQAAIAAGAGIVELQ